MKFLSRVGFLWMIKPFDTDHHVVSPGLPHALDVSDEGKVRSSSRQENGAVADTNHFLPTHYGFVKKLLCFSFHSSSLLKIRESKFNTVKLKTDDNSLASAHVGFYTTLNSPEWAFQTTSTTVLQEEKLKSWAYSLQMVVFVSSPAPWLLGGGFLLVFWDGQPPASPSGAFAAGALL